MARKSYGEKKAITSIDVAKASGFSQPTVSRVFNPKGNCAVAPEVKEKILAAAKELGYKPNFIASSMSSGRTNIIGIVVGFGIGPFYGQIINDLVARIQAMGKQCLMFKTDNQEQLDTIISSVLQFQVDGIIITSPAISKESIQSHLDISTPIILFNRFIYGIGLHSVYCDNASGGFLAGEYLAKKGHTNIAYVGYIGLASHEIERKSGFLTKLREYNIHSILEEHSEYSYESGREAARRIFSAENPPTAIFCTSDLIAVGVMDVAKFEFGLNVPGDVSIIGFDDIEISHWESYKLTTIRQPVDELMDNVLEILASVIDEPELPPQVRRVELQLIERESVSVNSRC